ncbi:MAG TPA: Yip1 family protein [Pyrinomonadaceae bacterium]
MNEQNNPNQMSPAEWQAPPPPERIVDAVGEPAQMSEPATLGGIFFEPGKTFDDLRRKPRFLMASLIIILMVTAFQIFFIQKIGYERMVRDRLESNSQTQQMPREQKEQIVQSQNSPVWKAISYGAAPIALVIVFALGGLIYWLGANAMGGSANFLHGISIWVYSSLPPTLIFMLANIIVLLLKSVDDIDIGKAQQGGLVQANPSMFIDGKASPVLAAVLGSIDLFVIWGWVLAAIGLQRVAKISAGAAWAIVLILGLIGVAIKVVVAAAFGG